MSSQRPVAPLLDQLVDRVSDVGDRLVAQLRRVGLLQVLGVSRTSCPPAGVRPEPTYTEDLTPLELSLRLNGLQRNNLILSIRDIHIGDLYQIPTCRQSASCYSAASGNDDSLLIGAI